MIRITPNISIDESNIEMDFVRASGPGGQKVNKTSSAVQLRFDVSASADIPNRVKNRLRKIAGSKMTSDDQLLIRAENHRTQKRNREEAIERFVELLQKAAHRPKPRRKTKPTKASKRRRLEKKKHRGEIKKLRKPPKGY